MSVVAKVLSDTSVATGKVYPRVLIYRGGDPDSVVTPEFYCEYGDGPQTTIPRTAKSDTHVGDGGRGAAAHRRLRRLQRPGSDRRCGQRDRGPEGYYDVFSTFVFTAA